MACPDFQSLTLPVLQSAAGGQELTLAALRAETARRLGLSEADLSEQQPGQLGLHLHVRGRTARVGPARDLPDHRARS